MSNIATVLKSEITRLARKEIRAETDAYKRMTYQHRSEIATLKRQIRALERKLKHLAQGTPAEQRVNAKTATRFSTKGLISHRQRLGLSADEFGALLGVTGQSIYKWESGKSRPRPAQIEALAEIRRLGRRAVRARLAASAPVPASAGD